MNKPSLPFFCHARAASSLAKARPNRYFELGIELNADRESLDSADLFKDLRMDKKNKPTEPLTKGEWK